MVLCSDSRRPVPGVQAYALNIEIAVENDSEDLLLHHLQVQLSKIAIAANKLGLGQVSAVDIFLLGVVLKSGERFVDRSAGNDGGAIQSWIMPSLTSMEE